MPSSRQPRDPELYRLTRIVALDALKHLVTLQTEGKELDRRHQVPCFDDTDSTFRTVSRTGTDISYRSAFGVEANTHYRPLVAHADLTGFTDLFEHVSSKPEIIEFLKFPGPDEEGWSESFIPIGIAGLPLATIERHIKCVGWDLSEEFFTETYCQLEQWWLDRELPVEVIVPIIGVSFTPDRIDLANGHYIERMSEGLQLVRWPGFNIDAEQRRLMPCSTHALVIPNFTFYSYNSLGQIKIPEEPPQAGTIEQFFQALSIVQPMPSGYVQYVYRPVGWANGFEGALPPVVHGPVSRRYAPALRPGMQEPSIVVDNETESRLVSTFERLLNPPKNVSIASSRLLGSTMREDPVDRILDLCIGIEALVSDNSPGDTTYKLALRTAAILASAGMHGTSNLFASMKGIYAFRSAVAHGGKNADKKRKVTIGGETYDACGLAEFILRELLSVFIVEGEMRAEDVDQKFILDVLSKAAKRVGKLGENDMADASQAASQNRLASLPDQSA